MPEEEEEEEEEEEPKRGLRCKALWWGEEEDEEDCGVTALLTSTFMPCDRGAGGRGGRPAGEG